MKERESVYSGKLALRVNKLLFELHLYNVGSVSYCMYSHLSKNHMKLMCIIIEYNYKVVNFCSGDSELIKLLQN